MFLISVLDKKLRNYSFESTKRSRVFHDLMRLLFYFLPNKSSGVFVQDANAGVRLARRIGACIRQPRVEGLFQTPRGLAQLDVRLWIQRTEQRQLHTRNTGFRVPP
jgi:hypothetical protein